MLTNEVLSPFVMFALLEETLSTLSVTCLFKREIEVCIITHVEILTLPFFIDLNRFFYFQHEQSNGPIFKLFSKELFFFTI